MMELIDFCRNNPVDDNIALPDVMDRVDLYREHQEKASKRINRNFSPVKPKNQQAYSHSLDPMRALRVFQNPVISVH